MYSAEVERKTSTKKGGKQKRNAKRPSGHIFPVLFLQSAHVTLPCRKKIPLYSQRASVLNSEKAAKRGRLAEYLREIAIRFV